MNVSMRGNSVYAQNHAKAGSIGGISLPDFEADYVYSKKQSKVSEQEYKKKIVEQAYKDYANGKFQNESKEFVSLMKRDCLRVFTWKRSANWEGVTIWLVFKLNINIFLSFTQSTAYAHSITFCLSHKWCRQNVMQKQRKSLNTYTASAILYTSSAAGLMIGP